MKRAQRRGSPVSTGDIQKLLFVCRQGPSLRGPRDAALIALTCSLGIPKEALCRLHVCDYSPDTAILNLKDWAGPIKIPPRGSSMLNEWLGVRGLGPGPSSC
jgi:hypothetical protein